MNESLPLVVANFKANKDWQSLDSWLEEIESTQQAFTGTIIVCPSFPFLAKASEKIESKNLKIKLGAQDVSRFGEGAFTGEVAASQIEAYCKYAIIGHSERRQNFKESEQDLSDKVQNAKNSNIEPIFCVQGKENEIPDGVKIVAYEPVFAIGTGNPDSPENAQEVAQVIKASGDYTVLYGGSVTAKNTATFLKSGTIDGVLVGSSSLNSSDFAKIIEAS